MQSSIHIETALPTTGSVLTKESHCLLLKTKVNDSLLVFASAKIRVKLKNHVGNGKVGNASLTMNFGQNLPTEHENRFGHHR